MRRDVILAIRRCLMIIFCLLTVIGGCAPRPRYMILEGKGKGFYQIGLCSYYGRERHGMRTANGEQYNMYALTAAHRDLPFGTLVKVTCLDTGRSVVVRVNDRGPSSSDRVIDLSYAAARIIGLSGQGWMRVRLDVIGVE